MIAEELLTKARSEFERVLQYVTEVNNTQISDMEKGIFRHLLKIGFILLMIYIFRNLL
jgi:Asp-tRNA(Asn)/Glu-tRNA(Gln) amidotransferase C subunit